jgi:hypothetical protein
MSTNHVLIAVNLIDELERITVNDDKFSLYNWTLKDTDRLEKIVNFLKKQELDQRR